MNSIRTIIIAATVALSAGYAQADETVKPLQGVSFHPETEGRRGLLPRRQGV